MKILFTKNIDISIISKELGKDILVDCIEVIRTNTIIISPFELKNYSLIFTSVNGVISFFKNKFKLNDNFTTKRYNKIYCIGEKTKRELKKYGVDAFRMLKNVETLSRFITSKGQHEQFLHFCGNLAINVLDKTASLQNQNIKYEKIIIYNTEELNPIITEKYHVAVFFSPSGVRSFARHNSLDGMILFSIGETTSAELRNYTKEKIFTSKENTLMSIFELIKKKLGGRI